MDALLTQYTVLMIGIGIAASIIGLLIQWFVIYTAVRSALRSDRERAERERYQQQRMT